MSSTSAKCALVLILPANCLRLLLTSLSVLGLGVGLNPGPNPKMDLRGSVSGSELTRRSITADLNAVVVDLFALPLALPLELPLTFAVPLPLPLPFLAFLSPELLSPAFLAFSCFSSLLLDALSLSISFCIGPSAFAIICSVAVAVVGSVWFLSCAACLRCCCLSLSVCFFLLAVELSSKFTVAVVCAAAMIVLTFRSTSLLAAAISRLLYSSGARLTILWVLAICVSTESLKSSSFSLVNSTASSCLDLAITSASLS